MLQLFAFRRSLRALALALCSVSFAVAATPASARPHHGRHARGYHAGHHARHYAHRHVRQIRAFSSEVDTGSRQENASNRKPRAPFRFNRNGKGSGADFGVTKTSKTSPWPFPKRACVDTYPSHPGALPGLPSQEASGRDRSTPKALAAFASGPVFWKAKQRFNAGWSSPVARQAHNLKVIGSNPIPATKHKRASSRWPFLRFANCFAVRCDPHSSDARSAVGS